MSKTEPVLSLIRRRDRSFTLVLERTLDIRPVLCLFASWTALVLFLVIAPFPRDSSPGLPNFCRNSASQLPSAALVRVWRVKFTISVAAVTSPRTASILRTYAARSPSHIQHPLSVFRTRSKARSRALVAFNLMYSTHYTRVNTFCYNVRDRTKPKHPPALNGAAGQLIQLTKRGLASNVVDDAWRWRALTRSSQLKAESLSTKKNK